VPSRLCSESGCVRQASSGSRCRVHAREHNRRHRSPNNSFYASKRWRITRRRKLFLNPLCEARELSDGAIAEEVHHIQAIEDGGDRYALDNLMAVCKPCHSRISQVNGKRVALLATEGE
jgi:5-methylcytosine-specific restriction protein A